MNPIGSKNVIIQEDEYRKEGGRKKFRTHHEESLKHLEKKLIDKGVQRMDRHPVDGLGGIGKPAPKSGRGGKYTWEGPDDYVENELNAPTAINEKDPNWVEEEKEKEDEEVKERVVGEVEVAKTVESTKGVGRVDVAPPLNANV